MNIEIYYSDFLHLCGSDLGRVIVRKDGVYLDRLPEDLLHCLSGEERALLSYKEARESFDHTDWEKPILAFPMTMEQFNLFTSLSGLSSKVEQQHLNDFIAVQEELKEAQEQHVQAMAGDRVEDRVYRGLLIPTVEVRDLDELITEASGIVKELDGPGESSADDVQSSGVVLLEEALCLLELLQDVSSSKSKNDLNKSIAHLEDAAVRFVFRVFERETKGVPQANDKVKKLMELFRSGRRKDGLDVLGNKMMAILREQIDAQEGDKRKFPVWRKIVNALERDSVVMGNQDSAIYEVEWKEGNRRGDEGTIEVLGSKEKFITFPRLRNRLTGYKKILKKEYQQKNISIS